MNHRMISLAVLAAGLLVSAAILWHAKTGRYQFFQPASVTGSVLRIDTVTGMIERIGVDQTQYPAP